MSIILVIDENPQIRHTLFRKISRFGHGVLTASDMSTAQNILEEHHKVDLLILKYSFADFSQNLVEIRKYNLPIIALVDNLHFLNVIPPAAEEAIYDFVMMPINYFVLNIKIQKILTEKEFKEKMEKEKWALEQEIKNLKASLQIKSDRVEELSKELTTFTSSISHDLRTPVRHITAFVHFLQKEDKDLDDKTKELIELIANAANKMNEMITGFFNLAKAAKTSLTKTRINIYEIIDRIIYTILTNNELDKNTKIDFKVENLSVEVMADKTLIMQVFTNLIENAIKYSSKKDYSIIQITCEEEGAFFVFEVSDNGDGFDMENADNLFQMFHRLHSTKEFEGTGVGLANVKQIVERHGGKVWAKGKRGVGASFYFTLPKG